MLMVHLKHPVLKEEVVHLRPYYPSVRRTAEDVRQSQNRERLRRGDLLGENAWLLGICEDEDAVREILEAEQNYWTRGRRCFVVRSGSKAEARVSAGNHES